MKINILHIILCLCITQQLYSQSDGVSAFSLPVRNSLKFNRYAINPTFSFVREQNKYITFTNKKQWVQLDNAPQTYLFSYSGRLKENIGIGAGLFQQDYGVISNYGGVLNFAYNAVLDRDNNLTFGVNLGYYQSGINIGKVIANLDDPLLRDIPSSSIITINPGVNYGTEFFDVGFSINNAVSYNLKTSEILEKNPEQSVQLHAMYTGYMNNRGFFDNAKFSSLIRSEFKKDQTVISGIMMLTVPKGIWGQIGYNSLYGASAGLGLSISNQIAIEYNYEQSIGDLSAFGNSHEITFAYKFNKKNRYIYNDDDNEESLFSVKKKKRVTVKNNSKPVSDIDKEAIAKAKEGAKAKAIEKIKRKAEARAKLVEEGEAKRKEEIKEYESKKAEQQSAANSKVDDVDRIKKEEQVKLKVIEDVKIKEAAITKAKADELARAKREEQAKLKEIEKAKIKEAKADELARVRREEQAKLKEIEDAKIKEAAVAKAKAKELARAKREEKAELKAIEDAKIKEATIVKTKTEDKIDKSTVDDLKSEFIVSNATDEMSTLMNNLKVQADKSKIIQQKLLVRLTDNVDIKQQDLDDLKKENDLSEKGIRTAPKPFKSIRAENERLESLKLELDNSIKSQNNKIVEFESLYKKRLRKFKDKKDVDNVLFSNAIKTLKSDQLATIKSRDQLVSKLATIKVATEIERKRRIKRAAFDNEEDRFVKDKATLERIKQHTTPSSTPLIEEDLDFGEELSNIEIVKDVKSVESGYYLVLAVHSSVEKRDEFLKKVVASGQKDINFFYDVASSKYFIYHEKYNDIGQAQRAINNKDQAVYNSRISMVKIEN